MNNLALTRITCKFLPPLFAGYLCNIMYPFRRAILDNLNFSNRSVTGSVFYGNTADLHCRAFAVHGYFDWRNILICKAVIDSAGAGDVIEIGANIGTETIGFADIVGTAGRVHAFEPLPVNLQALEKNCRENCHLPIKVYPVALSDREAVMPFYVPPKHFSGMGKVLGGDSPSLADSIQVKVKPLDAYLQDFKDVRAVFIDTEGHEPLVLRGSCGVIERHRPVVVLEVSPTLLTENSFTSADIFSFFQQRNYSCFNIGRFLLDQVTMDTLDKYQRHTNWICVPECSAELIRQVKKKLYRHIFLPLLRV